jgi:Ser/Thr protein kinase RdoA (MazF antagonist)
MTESHLLAEYLEVIGKDGEGNQDAARLASGQFHDVVLLGEVAYRFPRDEKSRGLLPARAELLSNLGNSQLPFAIPRLLSKAALSQPPGRCHVALRRLSGQPIERVTNPLAEEAVVSCLARTLTRLNELGQERAIRETVPRSDPRRWERFAEDVSVVLFPLMSSKGRKRAEVELNQVLALDPVGDALVHGDLGGENLLWITAESGPQLTGILDWDEAQTGNQANDLASIAVTVGWSLAMRLDARQHGGDTPTISSAEAIAGTFALQQALPAALSGDAERLADGLSAYHDPRE